MKLSIEEKYADDTINIALDTIRIGKQALVFVNTRRGAESQAEKIGEKIKDISLQKTSQEILDVLPSPTRQCKRLARCVKNGTAFHHSGLHYKQREIIEDNFKNGNIKIICATPTLAAGINMPAYRVILRDLKRYGGRGMQWIPVLEYEQMSGRCGRPKYDDHGEAICVVKSEELKEQVWERYIEGDPEQIQSKLAVEPVLRTYVLSLIAGQFCTTMEKLQGFFQETFYAHQYGSSLELNAMIENTVEKLRDWEFVKGESAKGDFVSASELEKSDEKLEATLLGKRISELYLDPYTANKLIESLRRAASTRTTSFSWLQMVCNTLEMRPLFRVKNSEYDKIREKALPRLDEVLEPEPPEFDYEYEQFLNSIKTALFMQDWIDENNEDYMLEEYDIRPGEVHAKLERADWLLYASQEIASILKFKPLLRPLANVRTRVKYGVKEELLPLLKLRNIGRVRARKMFRNEIKDLGDVKKVDVTKLVQILGKKRAIGVKKQVGIDLDKKKVPERKRKGQISLKDY